jgi:hypothetical protein
MEQLDAKTDCDSEGEANPSLFSREGADVLSAGIPISTDDVVISTLSQVEFPGTGSAHFRVV